MNMLVRGSITGVVDGSLMGLEVEMIPSESGVIKQQNKYNVGN